MLAAVLVLAGCGAPGSFADVWAAGPGTGIVDAEVVDSGFEPGAGSGSDGPAGPAVWAEQAPAAGNAAAVLGTLEVKGRAPKTGYARTEFGRRWADIDRDGCDQRNQVLSRDMDRETFKAGTHDCVVLTGTLRDAYTGQTISFTRGQGTSERVQIDHVVALSDAWQKGAQQLDATAREHIGNDPLNLIAVDGPTNSRKGDGDAATWLPPDTGYRCAYVSRQVAVKAKYDLWVTAAERDAIARVLSSCPDRSVPTDADAMRPAIDLR
ncbi:uncharacterized protein DUF1524 [Pseudonocardia autotrophica]|uniref:GmrSD restriction endonucleases C-terminal domain-containing protein n=2 Tax=Pseudonocardia TaxID=1847 RepID=A0A1Y2MWT2_PSEAH|nr:hypothetical protein BG845_03188 [Pseudonocardia autotrophica]TDN72722.1 uncharacterized protein DUF1524 [Pseudonocardia autotrophica]BBG03436.1 hypothetical protein Pdca_46450 [Pseudonocardia autotrophica]GEC24856.1 hypothetical protein PSA01_18850 [Pseudonocardia saturnea]